MNVQWQHVDKTAQRIIEDLEKLEAKIVEALERNDTTIEHASYGPARKNGAKFAKLKDRVRMALTYLKDGVQ